MVENVPCISGLPVKRVHYYPWKWQPVNQLVSTALKMLGSKVYTTGHLVLEDPYWLGRVSIDEPGFISVGSSDWRIQLYENEELKFYDTAMLTKALMIQWKASIPSSTNP